MSLEQEQCVECAGSGDRMTDEQAHRMLEQVPDWEIAGNTIQRTFSVADYVSAMQFADSITPIAEEQNHHPDLHISYGKVRIELSTHKAGGLTRNDFILAARIDQLWNFRREAASI